MKPGDRIEVYETITQPHGYYPELGLHFIPKKVVKNGLAGNMLFTYNLVGYDDTFYWMSEVKPIGCLIIKTVK